MTDVDRLVQQIRKGSLTLEEISSEVLRLLSQGQMTSDAIQQVRRALYQMMAAQQRDAARVENW